MANDKPKCENPGECRNEVYDAHTCPQRVEVDNDTESLCNCCDDCTEFCERCI